MKLYPGRILGWLIASTTFPLAAPLHAATLYVNANSANPVPPYTNWSTAAKVIQAAVDAALPHDEIVVTNGIYALGGRPVGTSTLTNRVAVDWPMTVRSVNGPGVTVIQGHEAPGQSQGAIRCVYLVEGAVLNGFTLTNGASQTEPGGGVYCASTNAMVTNCVLAGNSADYDHRGGGGAYGGTLYSCTLIGNSCVSGGGAGGAAYSTLIKCILNGNSAPRGFGGGAAYSTLYQCSLTGNAATNGAGAYWSTLYDCTLSTNIGAQAAVGCTLYNSTLIGNSAYGAAASTLYNCTLAGNYAGVYSSKLYNCIVYDNTADNSFPGLISTFYYCCTTPMPTNGVGNITNAPLFVNQASGDYHLQPSSPCINAGDNASVSAASDLDGNPRIAGGTVDMGAYEFQRQTGVTFVWQDSPNPTPPFDSWNTAAHVIQEAVDATETGGSVLVTNGTYALGGRPAGTNTLVNRVAVARPMTLRSVNGPKVTVIQGHQVPGITNGPGTIRCVFLCGNAVLSGFTLTNGGTRDENSDEGYGGGVWCESRNALVTNCMLIGNSAFGGAGVSSGSLVNSILTGNSARLFGGGTLGSALDNCTVVLNSSDMYGGGICFSPATNCIVYHNTAQYGPNYYWHRDSSVPYFCCTAPAPEAYYAGWCNITNEPRFVSLANGDFHLQPDSPCINSGNNVFVSGTADLDGNPRIAGGNVDIGAYEFQSPASTISYAWLQQFGLATDGSVDSADLDGDRHNNWQEWKAGTIPTNSLSVLRMVNPVTNALGLSVSWQSVADRNYFLLCATNLGSAPPFFLLRSNLVGQAGTTSYTDSNAIGTGPYFYRVGVQE